MKKLLMIVGLLLFTILAGCGSGWEGPYTARQRRTEEEHQDERARTEQFIKSQKLQDLLREAQIDAIKQGRDVHGISAELEQSRHNLEVEHQLRLIEGDLNKMSSPKKKQEYNP